MSSKKKDLNHFNFEDFKEEALSQIKSRQSLTGKDGILTPLIKQLLEAALAAYAIEPQNHWRSNYYRIINLKIIIRVP